VGDTVLMRWAAALLVCVSFLSLAFDWDRRIVIPFILLLFAAAIYEVYRRRQRQGQ
jgi:hypothetical protein